MTLEVARRSGQDGAVGSFDEQVLDLPAGTAADRFRGLQGRQKMHAIRMGCIRFPDLAMELARSESGCAVSPAGLAQASHAAAPTSPIACTATTRRSPPNSLRVCRLPVPRSRPRRSVHGRKPSKITWSAQRRRVAARFASVPPTSPVAGIKCAARTAARTPADRRPHKPRNAAASSRREASFPCRNAATAASDPNRDAADILPPRSRAAGEGPFAATAASETGRRTSAPRVRDIRKGPPRRAPADGHRRRSGFSIRASKVTRPPTRSQSSPSVIMRSAVPRKATRLRSAALSRSSRPAPSVRRPSTSS